MYDSNLPAFLGKWARAAFCSAVPLLLSRLGPGSARTNHFALLNAPSLSFCHTEETDLRCSVGPGPLLYFADWRKRAILALRAGLANFRYFRFPLSLRASRAICISIYLPGLIRCHLNAVFTPPSDFLSRGPYGCDLNTSPFLLFHFFPLWPFHFCNFKNVSVPSFIFMRYFKIYASTFFESWSRSRTW